MSSNPSAGPASKCAMEAGPRAAQAAADCATVGAQDCAVVRRASWNQHRPEEPHRDQSPPRLHDGRSREVRDPDCAGRPNQGSSLMHGSSIWPNDSTGFAQGSLTKRGCARARSRSCERSTPTATRTLPACAMEPTCASPLSRLTGDWFAAFVCLQPTGRPRNDQFDCAAGTFIGQRFTILSLASRECFRCTPQRRWVRPAPSLTCCWRRTLRQPGKLDRNSVGTFHCTGWPQVVARQMLCTGFIWRAWLPSDVEQEHGSPLGLELPCYSWVDPPSPTTLHSL